MKAGVNILANNHMAQVKLSKNTIGDAHKELQIIPGIGKSIAQDLIDIGIFSIQDLVGKKPETLYTQSNSKAQTIQDPCLLYTFRCAVYFAEHKKHSPEKLKWWYWKDKTYLNIAI